MLDPTTASEARTPEHARHIDRACDAFESAWKAGQRPTIEKVLEEAPTAVRRELLRELLELELAYRKGLGEPLVRREYLQRFPDDLNAELLAEAPFAQAAWADLLPTAQSTTLTTDLPPLGPRALSALPWPVVPGYEIVGKLGDGGMGVVYKAKQLRPPRLVALKMIRDGVLARPEHRERFRIETEAVARFQHPNLVRIYEVGEHAGLPFFSMECAEGGSLHNKLAGQPIPSAEAAELVRALAEAVHYAHDKMIVHRDLKPANVVLTGDGRPMITDFGLAKRLDSDTAEVTRSEAVLGTAGYMSPEQAEGRAKQVGPAADIYALGAILYEMLTGRPPFRAETWDATIKQVINEEPVPPTNLQPTVPVELETVCLKCLEKQPARRYASAHELAEDLRRFQAGESVIAVPVSEWDRQARWAARAGFAIEDVLTYGVRDIVYKAMQVNLDRPVALKVIAASAPLEAAALARLSGEAKIVALFDHPNIVRIYSAGELHGRTYLAFEYVDGGSLIERFVDQPVPPREAVRLVQQLAEAMHYAHRHGVLHCALKPSNVLLTRQGVPKISSFGSSIRLEQPEPEKRLAMRRLPSYMAPELMDDRTAEVGPATDVYSLGAILYKLLAGGPPFLGETVAQTMEQVRGQPAPAPSSLQPDVPAVLDAVCRRCLAKEPRERYASAGELADELGRFLAPQPTSPAEAGALPTFPEYELRRELGRGSMSIVYEARPLASDRLIALKIFQDHRYGAPLLAMLRDVAETVSRLQHPHLVEVYECGDHDSRPFFVMELLTGGSLNRRPAGAEMPIGAAADLVRTLARTMDAVHRHGIIHGNLKPSKILLAADGTPKITGFIGGWRGCALPRQDSAHMTIAAPAVMGTPRYMAPEQLSGDITTIGPAVDVHALGLLLYELLTGWLPFRGAALWDLLTQVRTQAPQPPRELRADLPAELETICLRCLAKQPEQRYASAAALAEALDHFLAGAPEPQWPYAW